MAGWLCQRGVSNVLQIKRIYDDADEADGYRILVDRLWPRGISKQRAALDLWEKEIAPTDALRKAFGHVPERFPAFKRNYLEELRSNPTFSQFRAIVNTQLKKGNVTLVYAAKDAEHNQAVVLKELLQEGE